MNGSIYFDPHPLLVAFMSVIVKRSAVTRSYPDGVEGFLTRHRPTLQDGQLFSLPCMSLDDVDHILALLNDEGIIPGEDIAVCDMHAGPLLYCDGIRLELDSTDDFLGAWFTYCDPAYVAPRAPEVPCDPTEPLLAVEFPAPPVVIAKGESTPWHRVTFGNGPVHWIGGYDEEDECRPVEPKSGPDINQNATEHPVLSSIPAASGIPARTIRIEYTSVLLASHGLMENPNGEHCIKVDEETFALITAGETVGIDGQGIHVAEEGAVSDRWLFNGRGPGTAMFYLDRDDGYGPGEDFEAIAIWFDEEPQPRPKSWWD